MEENKVLRRFKVKVVERYQDEKEILAGDPNEAEEIADRMIEHAEWQPEFEAPEYDRDFYVEEIPMTEMEMFFINKNSNISKQIEVLSQFIQKEKNGFLNNAEEIKEKVKYAEGILKTCNQAFLTSLQLAIEDCIDKTDLIEYFTGYNKLESLIDDLKHNYLNLS